VPSVIDNNRSSRRISLVGSYPEPGRRAHNSGPDQWRAFAWYRILACVALFASHQYAPWSRRRTLPSSNDQVVGLVKRMRCSTGLAGDPAATATSPSRYRSRLPCSKTDWKSAAAGKRAMVVRGSVLVIAAFGVSVFRLLGATANYRALSLPVAHCVKLCARWNPIAARCIVT